MRVRRLIVSRRRIGVAVDGRRLVARVADDRRGTRHRDTFWARELNADGLTDRPDVLSKAFAELAALVGVPSVFYVAILPPLAHFRIIDLPGVREAEAMRIVSRDPSRFLPLRGGTAAITLESADWRAVSPFELAAVPARLVDDITAAVRDCGSSLGSIVAAESAWAGEATAGWKPQRARRDIIVALEDTIEVVRLQGRRIASVRRVPREPDADPMADLGRNGVDTSVDATVIASMDDAMERAATGATRVAGPHLLAEEGRVRVRRRARVENTVRFAVAAALLVSAVGLELWKTSREHHRVVAERARIHAAVERALGVRESIAVVRQRIAAIDEAEANAPRWSELVASLAHVLPHDASLISLAAAGDSLRIEGAALRAAPVFDALAGAPGVRAVHPQGPIRQEPRAGGAASERFVVAATFASAKGKRAHPDHSASAGSQP